MWINIGRFFTTLLWVGFSVLWGWMIYAFCNGATDVGLAGLIGMCSVSVLIAVYHFATSFGVDYDDED